MASLIRRVLFCLFFLSGFSSLVYQVVWTRMAFASFGIIAPVLSVVLSVFMLGLALGSWAGGRLIMLLVRKTGLSAAFFYGIAELLIGCGAFAVPRLFLVSEHVLLGAGQLNSFSYLLYSALALAVSIFPWCLCMGATFPFMMAFVRERDAKNADSFSFLYVVNVLGAMCGTILTAMVLVETLGFDHTLWVAAGCNYIIALTSACLSIAYRNPSTAEPETAQAQLPVIPADVQSDRLNKAILFSTGFASMAMEVVWSRGFAGVLKTQVYSFALIIFAYLTATFIGSLVYRRGMGSRRGKSRSMVFWAMAVSAIVPIYVNDPSVTVQYFTDANINLASAILLLGSICPLCGLLGYLTPSLVDEYSAGQPSRAGSAYAANVVGCILGPLVACYLLLPHMSSRYALMVLALPFILFWLLASKPSSSVTRLAGVMVLLVMLAYAGLYSRDFDETVAHLTPGTVIRRDYIASVAAFRDQDGEKFLTVNGVGMTTLTPITKFISHLPLALHQGPSQSVLVICFGMGTTYRSALSWGVDTTVVELVPSVPKDFGFYFADAVKYASNPKGHIIIDDGRRYLSRCGRKFDIITVDPPPPVEAAGSSLLFSTDFYTLAKEHLNPGGIVQMWYPGAHDKTGQAVARSMVESFPFVRCFGSVAGWGTHLLGSMEPIVVPAAEQAIAKFPAAARADLIEWKPPEDAVGYLAKVLNREQPITEYLNLNTSIVVTDDRPFNEYYLLRRVRHGDN